MSLIRDTYTIDVASCCVQDISVLCYGTFIKTDVKQIGTKWEALFYIKVNSAKELKRTLWFCKQEPNYVGFSLTSDKQIALIFKVPYTHTLSVMYYNTLHNCF